MNLTKKLTPRPSNLLGAGLTAGVSVIMTMIARRNNPQPASGIDTAIRAAKWGLGGYVIGSFIDVQKVTRLGDGGSLSDGKTSKIWTLDIDVEIPDGYSAYNADLLFVITPTPITHEQAIDYGIDWIRDYGNYEYNYEVSAAKPGRAAKKPTQDEWEKTSAFEYRPLSKTAKVKQVYSDAKPQTIKGRL